MLSRVRAIWQLFRRMMNASYQRIYRAARRIPRGRVATYGQIAELAGLAGHARQVGYAMHALPPESDVPWHRVINAQGRISLRADGPGATVQAQLLRREGITIDADGRIDLAVYRWKPRARRPKF